MKGGSWEEGWGKKTMNGGVEEEEGKVNRDSEGEKEGRMEGRREE